MQGTNWVRHGKHVAHEEAERVRTLVVHATSAFFVVASAVLALLAALLLDGAGVAVMMTITTLLHLFNASILRWRTRSLLPTVYGQCLVIAAVIGFVGMHEDGRPLLVTPWLLAGPLYATYVAGPRGGALMAVLSLAVSAGGSVLHVYGLRLPLELGGAVDSLFFVVAHQITVLLAVFFGIVHDRTRRRSLAGQERLLAQLQESQARLEAVFESTSDGIVACDPEGRMLAANSAFLDLVRSIAGRPPRPGELVEPLLGDAATAGGAELIRRALSGEAASSVERIPLRGAVYHHELHAQPMWAEGSVVGFTLWGRDVTERVVAEEGLAKAHRDLLDLSRQAGIAEVATGLLHDVGNVLNSVNVTADQVGRRLAVLPTAGLAKAAERAREGDEPLARYLDQLAGHVQAEQDGLRLQVASLIEDVEHLRAIVSSQQRRAKVGGMVEIMVLEDLVESALEMHSRALRSHGVEVERCFEPVGLAAVDRHRVVQILANLVGNACDALRGVPRPRRLRVCTASDGDVLHVVVGDSGQGIAEADQPRIFEHGFTTKHDGHGFGLHSSANAARELGGSLEGGSAGIGQGATFTLELPRLAAAATPSSG